MSTGSLASSRLAASAWLCRLAVGVTDVLVGWRFDQFRLLGFGEEDSWLLVDSGADLQLTRSLVGAGCPLHLALRIVL